jgi:hypothetical protein
VTGASRWPGSSPTASSTGTGERAATAASAAPEPPVGEHRWGDPAREGAQLLEGLPRLQGRLVEGGAGGVRVGLHLPAGPVQLHAQPDQPLLGPVVDVPFQPAERHCLGRDGGVPTFGEPAELGMGAGRQGQQRPANWASASAAARTAIGRVRANTRPTAV